MIFYQRLMDAFDGAIAGEQWPSFARAVIATARSADGQSSEVRHLIGRAAALWEQRPSYEQVLAHKIAVWNFLEAKNGDSTTIADSDDRALRALLGALEHDGDRDAAQDAAEWIETVLVEFKRRGGGS